MLLYDLEHAPHETALLELAARMRRPIPDRIVNRPELLPGLEFYYAAFHEIHSDRPALDKGIRGSDIRRFCQDYELDEEMSDDVYFHVMAMDLVYLPFAWKKRDEARIKAQTKAQQKPGQGQQRRNGGNI